MFLHLYSLHPCRRSRKVTSPELRLPRSRSRPQGSKYTYISLVFCYVFSPPLKCSTAHCVIRPRAAFTHPAQLAGANAVRQSSHQRQRAHVSFDWILNQVCRLYFVFLPICRLISVLSPVRIQYANIVMNIIPFLKLDNRPLHS